MLRKAGAAIYRGLFWTYERGTWQYDVMVALILAFIFLTPRGWFQDQPSSAGASGVVLLSSNDHQKVYELRAAALIESEDEAATAEQAIREGAERILETYIGKSVQITAIKPEKDAHGQVVSYAVWVQE
jgi:hypothetical protein